jgi:serine/threonine protein kinase
MNASDIKNKSSVIGEGTYGCVIKPSLKCNKSKSLNYNNKISKVMDKSEALIELEEYKQMARIDKHAEYYTGKPEMCVPENSAENMNAIKECKYRDVKDLKKYYLLIMEDGGNNLTVFADSIQYQLLSRNVRADSKEYMDLQEIIRDFWGECMRLFQGIQVFLKNGLVHHDLKPQNILYDVVNNRANYIDFGLMTTEKKIKEQSMKSHNHNAIVHWSFPPEMPYTNKLAYTKFAKMSRRNKLREFDRFIKGLGDSENKINYFFKNTVIDYYKKNDSKIIIQHIKEYYDLLFKVIVPNKYSVFLEAAINTIDSYGLGVALLYVLNKTETLIDAVFAADLRNLFTNMVCFNVMKRKNIQRLTEEYKTILKRHMLASAMYPSQIQPSMNNKTKQFVEEKLGSIKIENAANITNTDPLPACPQMYEYNPITKRCVKTRSITKSKSKSTTRKQRSNAR